MTEPIGNAQHSADPESAELSQEVSKLRSDFNAIFVSLVYLCDKNAIILATAGETNTKDAAVLSKEIHLLNLELLFDDEGASIFSIPLVKIDNKRSYVVVVKQTRKFFARKTDERHPSLFTLRRSVYDHALRQVKREHDAVVSSLANMLSGFDNPNQFKRTLKSLLSLSGCVEGSIWEYHDTTAYGDIPFLTLEATANHDISVYDETCLPKGRGVVWDALNPGAKKIQYFSKVDKTKVINRRLSPIYENQPLSLYRLEFKGSIFGVACLYGVSSYDMPFMDAAFETFEQLTALAISTKRLELKASSLAGLRAIIPSATHGTPEKVCDAAAKKIRKQLNCQAASIFLREGLVSTADIVQLYGVDFDEALTPSRHTTDYRESGRPVSYNINEQSLTTSVIRLSRVVVSNQVSQSAVNSHKYREITSFSNDTWIGVPIKNSSGVAIGIIRCTGKEKTIDGTRLRYIFDKGDIDVLEYYADILARVLESVVSSNRLENVNKRLALAEEIRTHEMYSPLLAISGNARWVKNYLNEPAATSKQRRLEDIITDSEMCAFLLRETSLPSVDDMTREARSISLNALLTKMKEFLVRRIQARSPRKRGDGSYDDFSADYERLPIMRVELYGSSPRIYAHPILLQRALYNIASNAVKYGRRGGYLKISQFADSTERLIYIDFEDDGIGIEECDKDMIFGEGSRGTNVPSDKYPGSGLGLYIAREVIFRHGGTLSLTSLKNPTKFRVILPFDLPKGTNQIPP